MTKKDIIEAIKDKASNGHGGILELRSDGNSKGCLRVPIKEDDETWKEYFENNFEIDVLGKGEYILTIKLGCYDGYVSMVIDSIDEY